MKKIDDNSIDCVVTSPPYNCNKEYETEISDEEYYEFALKVSKEFRRILKPDGRFAINVVFNINRVSNDKKTVLFPYIQWINALLNSNLKIKEDIIWDQYNSGCETAWGSWKSASAPHIRHMTERIIVGYKQQWKLTRQGDSDISVREFMQYTNDKWVFSTERDRTHPAPYPQELPYRCIKLFSYVNDIVLDPFMGSGTTALVCKLNDRRFIGFETSKKYCDISKERLNNTIVCQIANKKTKLDMW